MANINQWLKIILFMEISFYRNIVSKNVSCDLGLTENKDVNRILYDKDGRHFNPPSFGEMAFLH